MGSNIKFSKDEIYIIASIISKIEDENVRNIAQESIANSLIQYTDESVLKYPEEFEWMVEEMTLYQTSKGTLSDEH